jgi:hypothetical protein
MKINTGISKIILVQGGHGLENVSLNLFRVAIGLPAPFYESQSQFRKTHQHNL